MFYFDRMVKNGIPEVKFIENPEQLDDVLENPGRVWVVLTPFWAWLIQPELIDWFSRNSEDTVVIDNVIVLPFQNDI